MSQGKNQYLEIEVKFFIEDEIRIKNKLRSIGAISQGRVFESNIRYEDEDENLQRKRILLRLRKDREVRLTVKTDSHRQHTEFKILKELEVAVSDFDVMNMILNTLGFHQAQIYEKWRETFVLADTLICLDSLPFGIFLEIEGGREAICATADALGLDWERRILSNYLEIFEYLRNAQGLGFTDVTFDNFRKTPIEFKQYCKFFEAEQE